MNHIDKTIFLVKQGRVAICNPMYLSNQHLTEQQEKSMLGNRTVFLAFHRFMFDLQNSQIDKIWHAYKTENVKAQVNFPDEKCCDLLLLCDAIQYQIAIRHDNQADPAITEEIAISFHQNAKLANDFEEITSDYLINVIKKWIH